MAGQPYAPSDYDIYVGRLIQLTRIRFGMSQKDLAVKIGTTFQQVQKYETAGNRIAMSRMKSIADAFEMPISALLQESEKSYLHDKDVLSVMTAMYRTTPQRRKLIMQLADAIATSDN